jgi:hypothetical protein
MNAGSTIDFYYKKNNCVCSIETEIDINYYETCNVLPKSFLVDRGT